ncbi:hypothetical protein OAT06_06135 [Nitrospinaceae bacterium]|nr:hypothetical protein [Nitrospinaceae bacterium]
MRKYIFFIIIFIFIAQNAIAHGGHKKEPTSIAEAEEKPIIEPMYATQEEESDPLENSGLFSPSDLFMESEIVPAEPNTKTDMKMEGSHNEHDDLNMSKVVSAKHKTVETSAKGYGIAAGITLFAGLVFAGLTFIRPGE